MTADAATSLRREIFSAVPGQRRWHVARNGERRGPLSDAEIVMLAGDGAIGAEDLIWRPGYLGWTPAGKIAGLLIPPDLPQGGAPAPHTAAPPPPPMPPAMPSSGGAPPAAMSGGQPDQPAVARSAEPPAAETAITETRVADAPADAPDEGLRALLMAMGAPTPRKTPYVMRHWRGELPLSWSFWVNGILFTLPVVMLCAWIIFTAAQHPPAWLAAAAPAWSAHLPGWLWPVMVRLLAVPAIALQGWCIVGIFRSACRRDGMWGEVATATAVCSALCCTAFTLLMLRG